MTQKIIFHNDPTQLNIWSHVKERLYASFDLIVRDNITKHDCNVVSYGTIRQVTQILPASILNKNAKTVLGAHNDFDFEVLKREIEENAMLGFHTSPEHLALHPDLECRGDAEYFAPYYEAYHAWGNIVRDAFATDATICTPAQDHFLNLKTPHIERKDYTHVMVMPFLTMMPPQSPSLTDFENSLYQDEVVDHIQQAQFADFNHGDGVPSFGWFDCVRAKHFVDKYQCKGLVLTFPDLLPVIKSLQLCSAYLVGNDVCQTLSSGMSLGEAKPFYETYEGWEVKLSDLSQLHDFPAAFFKVIKRIEQLVGCPVLSVVTSAHTVRDSKIDLSFPILF